MTGPADEHDPGQSGPDDDSLDEPVHDLDDMDFDDFDPGVDDPDEESGGGKVGGSNALPPKMEAWRRRSAAGAILTGFALGLQQALEPKRDEPSIVVQTSGDPPTDLPVEAEFEYRRPRNTVVNVRPWLLEGGQSEADPDSPDDDEAPE